MRIKMTEIVDRLKHEMERRHLSQRQYAKLFGVTPGAVTRWFQGIRRPGGSAIKILEGLEKENAG
jgi:transcriptional regulator with XRE-family HTH domain